MMMMTTHQVIQQAYFTRRDMTDKEKAETLAKALKRAIDSGLTGYWADRYKRCVELDEIEFLAAGNVYEEGHSPEELFYSQDFAKALWGKDIVLKPSYETTSDRHEPHL